MALTALEQYIPLQTGQANFLIDQNLVYDLGGLIGYEVHSNFVVFTEDITDSASGGENVNAVDMQLIVMDLDAYGEYDLLPLTSDQAAQVVAEVASLLMGTPERDGRVDSITTEHPKKRPIE